MSDVFVSVSLSISIPIKAPSVLGEDPSSIEAHVNVLHSQYQKMQPDFMIVRDPNAADICMAAKGDC